MRKLIKDITFKELVKMSGLIKECKFKDICPDGCEVQEICYFLDTGEIDNLGNSILEAEVDIDEIRLV